MRKLGYSPPSKPRVAYILQDFAIGGIETCLFNIASALHEEFEFHFIATHVAHIESKFYRIGYPVYIPKWIDLIHYLEGHHFDLVQTHNLRVYIDCAMAAGVPIIVERIAGNRAASNSKEGVDRVIASNYGTLPLIEKIIDPSLVTVIYNGIDIEYINSFTPDRLGFSKEDIIIGRVSRLGGGQNISLLIKAVIEISRRYPKVKLVIVGAPSRMPGAENILPELRELAKPLGKDIVFTGEIDRPYQIVKGFDIATCVSNHEGIPNSLIEPMACGIPVVSTDVGQINELVEDGVNGFLIPCHDKEALIHALEKLITDPSLRSRFGQKAKDRVEKNFALKKQAQKYAALYQWLISGCHLEGSNLKKWRQSQKAREAIKVSTRWLINHTRDKGLQEGMELAHVLFPFIMRQLKGIVLSKFV